MLPYSNKKTHRCDPKRNKKLHKWELITPQQQKAINLALNGRNQSEIAEAVGFRREAVNRWFNQDSDFKAALAQRKHRLFEEVLCRYPFLVQAFNLIEQAAFCREDIQDQQLVAAVDLVKVSLIKLLLKEEEVEAIHSSVLNCKVTAKQSQEHTSQFPIVRCRSDLTRTHQASTQ